MFFDELNDESLLQHLKASSEPAFKTLYRRYWRKCFAMAFRKIGVKSIAEEITQTVFVSLWEKRNDLIIHYLEAYLFTAVKYQFFKYIEAQLVRTKYEAQLDTPLWDENIVEKEVFLVDLTHALEKAVLQLPEKTQQIYRLSRIQHLSHKEIAIQVALSEKSVEYHITQALKSLREALKDFL
jgi:RNA polymerase sigma-70 factor (family 1)